MKILMVHPHDLYSSSEPWTIRIKKIAEELAERGHRIRLLHFPIKKRPGDPGFIGDKIEVIPLNRRAGPHILLRNIGLLTKLAGWCDIIHVQKCFYHSVVPALVAAWVKRKPFHYDWDDWETKIFYYSNPHQVVVGEFVNTLEKLIPRIADTVSVSSRYLFQLAVSRGGRPENIVFAPVGADLRQFCPEPAGRDGLKETYGIKGNLVLYLGQLHGGQYVEMLIKAARIVVDRNPRTVFMVVGDGYRARELRRMVGRLNLTDNFIFTGIINHDEIQDYIAGADICVACFADNEITRCKSPLKIVEYLACGKAVVASNVGEVKNMVGGVGVLTEPGNPASLARGIDVLINNRRLRRNLEQHSRMRVINKYNWKQTAENILSAYNAGLSAQTGKAG